MLLWSMRRGVGGGERVSVGRVVSWPWTLRKRSSKEAKKISTKKQLLKTRNIGDIESELSLIHLEAKYTVSCSQGLFQRFNPLDAMGISLNKQKSMYKVLAPSIITPI